jgi:hypothetical protein
MKRSFLWEGVQPPLKTKALFPTCTLFDLTFGKEGVLLVPAKSAALKRAWVRAESKRLATQVRDFHARWCADGA